ncbi:MAG: DUF898 family protein [Zoogloeaceae bacterium]|jgi:uncharacterized membrane protein YjgN (DUF898 family)|nr:DUF898 family protein [Zoogloeaceae bacterium]
MSMPTHYQTLGLPEGAGIDEVRAACNKALQHFIQQQRTGAPLPMEDFEALQAARAEIGDPRRKARYDQELAARRASGDGNRTTPALFSGATTIAPAAKPAPSQNADEVSEHRFQFTGSGGEYFRIWITNLLYTLLTLGMYSAWAKVRREQYFHRNTLLDGSGFDYHGNPVAILKGRMLAGLLLVIYSSSQRFFPWPVYTGVLLLALPLLPWLVQRSLVFRARNSSYRGLRFDFHGSYRTACATLLPYALCTIFMLWSAHMVAETEVEPEYTPQSLRFQIAEDMTQTNHQETTPPILLAQQEPWETGADDGARKSVDELAGILAKARQEEGAKESARKKLPSPDPKYAIMMLLSILLLSLCTPWFLYSINRFRLNHLAFAHARFRSHIRVGAFYRIAIIAGLMPTLSMTLVAILFSVSAAAIGAGRFSAVFISIFLLSGALLYLGIFSGQAYTQSQLNNEIWNETELEKYHFSSDQSFQDLLLILAGNFLLTLLTLGLYWPWAKVRLARYRADHLALLAPSGALDEFAGQNSTDDRAIGEEIADAFDFDIAL